MELPKRILHKKLNADELIEILENLEKQKARAIKDQQYQYAAELRDKERKFREQLEDLMNPRLKTPKTIHVIGLGGAGSNMLLQFYNENPNCKFSMVTDPIRTIPEQIHFVHYTHHFPFRNKLESETNLLPEELTNRIKVDEHIILLTGLGGATGTILTDQLIQFCINSNISFQVGCSWPLPFEGSKRFLLAEEFLSKYNSYSKVFVAKKDTETILEQAKKEGKMIGDLFVEVNTRIIQSMLTKVKD